MLTPPVATSAARLVRTPAVERGARSGGLRLTFTIVYSFDASGVESFEWVRRH